MEVLSKSSRNCQDILFLSQVSYFMHHPKAVLLYFFVTDRYELRSSYEVSDFCFYVHVSILVRDTDYTD